MVTVVSVPVVQALCAHVLAQVACVCCQTSNGNTHVIIDVKNFLLMAGKVMG
jgi:hypothetical protein